MGHSRSLKETHCRLEGSMISTVPLVPLTASVPLMTMLQQAIKAQRSAGSDAAGCQQRWRV